MEYGVAYPFASSKLTEKRFRQHRKESGLRRLLPLGSDLVPFGTGPTTTLK
jgi:hypothetical protein